MKERNGGLKNESSKTKRIGLFQRITAAFLLPLIIIYKKVSSTFLLNLFLFWHINEGIEEIMADYVHQEMTRNLILVYLRLFFLIVIKDVFLSLEPPKTLLLLLLLLLCFQNHLRPSIFPYFQTSKTQTKATQPNPKREPDSYKVKPPI